MIGKLLSGAQTGADRAALDWAIFHDIPHGGWCPATGVKKGGHLAWQTFATSLPTASIRIAIADAKYARPEKRCTDERTI
jgi:hypothetical protein